MFWKAGVLKIPRAEQKRYSRTSERLIAISLTLGADEKLAILSF
jgi:hypothetical protein